MKVSGLPVNEAHSFAGYAIRWVMRRQGLTTIPDCAGRSILVLTQRGSYMFDAAHARITARAS